MLAIKANMNKRELYKIAVIFFFLSNRFLKQGTRKVFIMVDFG